MIISEIIAGVVAIIVGAFAIFLFTLKEEIKLNKNPFYDLLGISKSRQRAYGIIAGVGFCLVGLFMIFQGFGFFR